MRHSKRNLAIFDLDNDIQALKRRKFENLTGLEITPLKINSKIFKIMLNMIISGYDIWILTSTYTREEEIRSLLKSSIYIGEYADKDILKIITNDWDNDDQGENFKIDLLMYMSGEDRLRLTHVIRDTDEVISIELKDGYYNFSTKEIEDYRTKVHEEWDKCDISF